MSDDCIFEGSYDGDCCCNCIHLQKIKPPKIFNINDDMLSFFGYYCDAFAFINDDINNLLSPYERKIYKHGMCELHERK